MRTYYSVWVIKSRKNDRIWQKRKCCFIKAMHQFTDPLSRWPKSMSWSSNCSLSPTLFAIFSLLGLFSLAKLEKWLGGQRFANNVEVESAVNSYFEELDSSHSMKRVSKLLNITGEVYRAKTRLRWEIRVFLPNIWGFLCSKSSNHSSVSPRNSSAKILITFFCHSASKYFIIVNEGAVSFRVEYSSALILVGMRTFKWKYCIS